MKTRNLFKLRHDQKAENRTMAPNWNAGIFTFPSLFLPGERRQAADRLSRQSGTRHQCPRLLGHGVSVLFDGLLVESVSLRRLRRSSCGGDLLGYRVELGNRAVGEEHLRFLARDDTGARRRAPLAQASTRTLKPP